MWLKYKGFVVHRSDRGAFILIPNGVSRAYVKAVLLKDIPESWLLKLGEPWVLGEPLLTSNYPRLKGHTTYYPIAVYPKPIMESGEEFTPTEEELCG